MDAETTELDALGLIGGYRLLCASLLKQAVDDISRERNVWYRARNSDLPPSPAADWLEKETVGAITFRECCDVFGVLPERAKERILEHAYERRRDKPASVDW